MPSVDILKQMRGTGYMDKPSEEKPEEEGPSGNRLIKLSDDEMKSLGDYKEGERECMVRGTMTDDGMFRIMSVSPTEEAGGGEEQGMDEMMKMMMAPKA